MKLEIGFYCDLARWALPLGVWRSLFGVLHIEVLCFAIAIRGRQA